MIKLEKIGSKFRVKFNGMMHSGTVANDPSQYEYYRTLGLDIFEDDERKLVMLKLDNLGIRYRPNSKLQTLLDKLPKEEE